MAKANDKIGPYTLVRKLGRGTFGVVWLAEKRSVLATKQVALKLPRDEEVDLDAIKQEAAVWVHASGHPNVLPIIDADVYDGQVVIVSEYAPDGSLSKWIEEHDGRAPFIESAVEMTQGILAGLEHLHRRGVIHRDIKPDNILLQNETPLLADFGIARVLKVSTKSTMTTGTPAYMSPEAFDGKRSEQTDIWSVGVILYQMLSGRLPFPQTDLPMLLASIATAVPEPLPDSVPQLMRETVARALEKNPERRFKTAAEMRKALRGELWPITLPDAETLKLDAHSPTVMDTASNLAAPPTGAGASAQHRAASTLQMAAAEATPGQYSEDEDGRVSNSIVEAKTLKYDAASDRLATLPLPQAAQATDPDATELLTETAEDPRRAKWITGSVIVLSGIAAVVLTYVFLLPAVESKRVGAAAGVNANQTNSPTQPANVSNNLPAPNSGYSQTPTGITTVNPPPQAPSVTNSAPTTSTGNNPTTDTYKPIGMPAQSQGYDSTRPSSTPLPTYNTGSSIAAPTPLTSTNPQPRDKRPSPATMPPAPQPDRRP